jgi:hypothetical protein
LRAFVSPAEMTQTIRAYAQVANALLPESE